MKEKEKEKNKEIGSYKAKFKLKNEDKKIVKLKDKLNAKPKRKTKEPIKIDEKIIDKIIEVVEKENKVTEKINESDDEDEVEDIGKKEKEEKERKELLENKVKEKLQEMDEDIFEEVEGENLEELQQIEETDEEQKLKKEKKPKKIALKNPSYQYDHFQNFYEILSNETKLQNEIGSITNEYRNTFREALNKYDFSMEVFVPRTLVISKKEYLNKDYLLNHLVESEKLNREKKKVVEPLSKETANFTRHYKLVQNDGQKRKEYINNLERFYEINGYKLHDIEYKKGENIFSPSVLLDTRFGENGQEDVFKYGSTNFQKDYNKDKKILNVIYRNILQNRKNKKGKKKQEAEQVFDGVKNYGYEYDYQREEYKKQIDEIKEKLIEEDRIRNMSSQDYYIYIKKIRKEINKTKRSLQSLAMDDTVSKSEKKPTLNNIPISRSLTKNFELLKINKMLPDYNINNSCVKNEKNIFKLNPEFRIETVGKKTATTNYEETPELRLTSQKKLETESNIFVSSKGMTLYSNKKELKNSHIDESLDKSLKIKQKDSSQIKELDRVYKIVLANKKNRNKYPLKNVENYFRNYTKKKLPLINYKKGSNVHGLLDEFQDSVKNKNFHKIAKSNNDLKRDLYFEKGFTYQDFCNKVKTFDIDKIEEIDRQIPILHYSYAEKLLSNLKDIIVDSNK